MDCLHLHGIKSIWTGLRYCTYNSRIKSPLQAAAAPLQKLKSCCVGWRSGDRLGHRRIFHFFASKDSWVTAFAVFLGPLSICCVTHRVGFVAFGRMWAEIIVLYASEFTPILLSAVTWPTNSSEFPPLAAVRVRPRTLPPPRLDHQMLLYCSRLFFSRHPDTSSSWFHPSKEADSRNSRGFFRLKHCVIVHFSCLRGLLM